MFLSVKHFLRPEQLGGKTFKKCVVFSKWVHTCVYALQEPTQIKIKIFVKISQFHLQFSEGAFLLFLSSYII